jgi:hypothetical protein
MFSNNFKERDIIDKLFRLDILTKRKYCVYCKWNIFPKYTRMVEHIAKCLKCPDEIKVLFPKKDSPTDVYLKNKKRSNRLIHTLFGRNEYNQRTCMYCNWKTVNNLTRMAAHLSKCPNCPDEIKDKFLVENGRQSDDMELSDYSSDIEIDKKYSGTPAFRDFQQNWLQNAVPSSSTSSCGGGSASCGGGGMVTAGSGGGGMMVPKPYVEDQIIDNVEKVRLGYIIFLETFECELLVG